MWPFGKFCKECGLLGSAVKNVAFWEMDCWDYAVELKNLALELLSVFGGQTRCVGNCWLFVSRSSFN